jgi:tetratricopeptide (TPR) repeat protein
LWVGLLVCPGALCRAPEDWREAIIRASAAEFAGDYSGAREILGEALKEARLHPEDHERAGIVLMRLGWMCHILGDYEEAHLRLRAAISQLETAFGKSHRAVGRAMNQYAAVCEIRRDWKEAERFRGQALAILIRELGPNHPETLLARNDLALGLSARGGHAAAVESYREILAAWPESSGTQEAVHGQIWINLGYSLLALKRHAEAREALERGVSILMTVVPRAHPVFTDALYGLAQTEVAARNWAAADRYLREAQELAEAALLPCHPVAIRIFEARSQVLNALGRKPEARQLQKMARSLREKAVAAQASVSWSELAASRGNRH